MNSVFAAFSLLLGACVNGSVGARSSADRLGRAEARLAEQRQSYVVVAADVERMRWTARFLSERAQHALRELESATRDYERAKVHYGRASDDFQNAAANWHAAAAAYRAAATIMIVTATAHFLLHGLCGPRVSTRQFRRQLEESGVDTWGQDMDHIIPRAHGGPDRPWNYQPLDSSINRSLGADLTWKLANMPLATLTALAQTIAFQLLCAGP